MVLLQDAIELRRHHNNTQKGKNMIKVTSLFSQLLNEIPKTDFSNLVIKHKAEYAAKGFSCWTQLVSMLFCHLAQADSLREICGGLACCLGKLTHLGIKDGPKKSTLSYANENRPAELYQDVFWNLSNRFRNNGLLGKIKKFRFKNKMLSMDSTTISLCLALFPWAKFRRAKGGVKVHVLLDHDDYMPSFIWINPAKGHDIIAARLLNLPAESIVAFDKAYNDYVMFNRWTEQRIWFVTRIKDNAQYEIVEEKAVPQNRNITADQVIRLTGLNAAEKCPHLLRRVVVWDEENKREIVLLTNHLDFGATTISAIYKERWQIEIFFKTLKQNLKVKTFVGTSENALKIQIWTALISLLLLKWLHFLSQARWSLSNLASMLRMNLFTYRNLQQWLDNPYGTPPLQNENIEHIQMQLDFGQATV
jgi:hypothetical protein